MFFTNNKCKTLARLFINFIDKYRAMQYTDSNKFKRGDVMQKIIISTESGADLPYKIYIPNDIKIIPMHVVFGSKSLAEGHFDIEKIDLFFNKTKTLPKTSAINPNEYVRHFKSLLTINDDCRIIHISYSSKLTSCCQNARIAAEIVAKDRVTVIDSQSASAGVGVLVMQACSIIKKYYGKLKFDECVSLIKARRSNIVCTFMPDKLDYLKAGGRVSSAVNIGASVLNLKPSLSIENGEIVKGKVYRGKIENIAKTYLEDFVKNNNVDKHYLIIGYTYKINKLLLFALKRQAHKMGFKKSWCFMLGSTITCHTGPDCIGFAGVKSNRTSV